MLFRDFINIYEFNREYTVCGDRIHTSEIIRVYLPDHINSNHSDDHWFYFGVNDWENEKEIIYGVSLSKRVLDMEVESLKYDSKIGKLSIYLKE